MRPLKEEPITKDPKVDPIFEDPKEKRLIFEPHIRSLCKKGSQELNAFTRIAYSLKFEQRKILLNAFITSQLSYAPVVWMFHNQKLINHIPRIHERALKIVYQDHSSTFDELLGTDGSFKIHGRNLQKLLIEIFKVKMNLDPEIMNEAFDIIECPYPLRNELRFKSLNICTVKYRIERDALLAPGFGAIFPVN